MFLKNLYLTGKYLQKKKNHRTGAAAQYNFDGPNAGKYMDGNKEVSFAVAMGQQGLNEDGSKKSEESSDGTSSENTTENSSDIHPRGKDFENRPRTTKVIEQLYSYVKNHPSILQTLAEYSGYSTMEVLQQLKYKQGNMILGIESLLWDKRHPDGITLSSKDIRLEIAN